MGRHQKEWAARVRDRLTVELGGKCAKCGTTRKLEFDCIKPRGHAHHRLSFDRRMSFYMEEHVIKNLQLLCQSDNATKSGRLPWQLAAEAVGGNGVKPRPFQAEVLAKVAHGFDEFDRQLIVIPTGGGKTCIFAWEAERRQKLKQRALILAHREELVDQAIDKINKATSIRAEKEKAEHVASLGAPVVVASIQTMQNRLGKWPSDHFGLVICDEAHHAISGSWQAVLQYFTGAQVLGVTATPDRGDKRNLGEYFENIAAEVSLFDLINQGYLSRITLKSIPLKLDLSKVKSAMGDFADRELGEALEPYLPQIAEAIKAHASFRRVLAFLPLIKTSQKFVEACRAAGLRAEHVDGNSEDRAEKLARFAAWEFDILSNAMLLTEGYDDPSIDCIAVLRPTRSRPLYAQMVGRGTRAEPDKENLLLLDFLWMHEKHSITRPAHLIAKTEQEAEEITKLAQEKATGGGQAELDLQGLASETTQQREQALAKSLAENKDKKGKFISADEFALAHHTPDLFDWEPSMRWEAEPITPAQSRYLKKAGIDASTVRGKGHATQLLNIYFSGKRLELASEAQRAFMRRMGHPNPDTATAAEARQFFAAKNYKRKKTQ